MDFIYIDGDHTLRGIALDLLLLPFNQFVIERAQNGFEFVDPLGRFGNLALNTPPVR